MAIIAVTISILVITGIVRLLNKVLPFRICPVCAGVSLTWLWLFVGVATNNLPITNYQLLLGILMGGSVVGIAYQVDKKLPLGRSLLLWKTIFIPLGFIAVYSVIGFAWEIFLGAIILMMLTALFFMRSKTPVALEVETAEVLVEAESSIKTKRKRSKKAEELEKKMEECC